MLNIKKTPALFLNEVNKLNVKTRQILFNVFVCVLIILVSFFAWWQLELMQQKTIEASVVSTTRMFSAYVSHDLDINIQPILNMTKRWSLKQGLSKKEWLIDAAGITTSYPSFLAVEWVSPSSKVEWAFPLKENEKVLGLNLIFETVRRNILQESYKTRQGHFSQVIDLIQGEKGFVFSAPIYLNNNDFSGFLLGVYSLKKFIKNLFSLHEYDDFNINIYAGNKLILKDVNQPHTVQKYAHSLAFEKDNIRWRIELIPSHRFVKKYKSKLPLAIFIAGLLLAAAMFLILTLLNLSRKKAFEVRLNAQRLDMTYHAVVSISEARQFDEAIRNVLNFICKKTHWPIGHAYMLNHDMTLLESTSYWYIAPEQRLRFNNFVDSSNKIKFKKGEGLPGRTWQRGEPVWIANIHNETDFPRLTLCDVSDLRSAFAFPVFSSDGDIIVILEFFSYDVILKDDLFLSYLQTLSVQLTNSISRLAMEDKVRVSEMKYRNVIEGAVNAIIMMDHKGVILECNQATDDLFGQNEINMVGEKLSSLLSPQYAVELDEYIRIYLETGQRVEIGLGKEIIVSDKNLNSLPIFISVSEIELEGDVYFIAMLQDMSSQKHTEKALKSSQARELILRYIDDGLYGVDLRGRITFANPAGLALLGYKEDEVLNKVLHEQFHHSHADGSKFLIKECLMQQAILQGKAFSQDNVVLWNKNNETVQVNYASKPMRKDGKLIGSAITVKPSE